MQTNLLRIKKDLEELAKYNATPGNGLTRFSLTEEDQKARKYLKKEMKLLGIEVYEDAAGTIIGRIEGEIKDGPVVMLGSHFDSVKNGGNFDGSAGVITGLEVARVIKENNIKTKYPIEIIGMIEEEGGRFGSGVFGSRAMVGKVTKEQLINNKDENGVSMYDAMQDFGINPEDIDKAKRDKSKLRAFIELHIEQGPILEKFNQNIGIVDFIVGIHEFKVIIKGRPDHAGTTPMDMRANPLDTAAKVISRISDYAKNAGEGTVATVGVLNVKPGAANIVPSEVMFTVDIRSKNSDCIDKVGKEIEELLKVETEDTEVKYEIVNMLNVKPVKLSEHIIEKFSNNCEKLGFSNRKMLSGAGHDAMIMAEITDVGLLFVPSKDGRSHCPEEWTDYEDLQKGIEVVLNTVLDIAEVIN